LTNYSSAVKTVPNQGIGRLVDFKSKGKARQVLLEARRTCHRDASPEHKVDRPPKLISAKDLSTLRRELALVSFISTSFFNLIFLTPPQFLVN